MELQRVEGAPRGEDGFYRPASEQPVALHPGQALRVSLDWRALDAPGAERYFRTDKVDNSIHPAPRS